MIKVMITDDHQLIREGLKQMVEVDTTDIKVVQEACSAAESLKVLSEALPDILVLDIDMPGRNGLDVLKDIRGLYPWLPVLVLSMHREERFAIRAMKAEASGYLNKSSIANELVHAIRLIVLQKKKYISSSVAEQLAQRIDGNCKNMPHEKLTDREFQILCMIANGKKSSAIADELSLSIQTVHTYRTRLKQKMNLNSNVDLTLYAIRQNLVD
ncbi:MAG: response regulator transcription factor [Balneolaceae bacterium]